MRQNPFWNALITIINLGAVFLAAYLAIDALDASRRQTARTDQTLNRLSDAVDRLNQTLGDMKASLAAAPAPASATDHAAAAKGGFGG